MLKQKEGLFILLKNNTPMLITNKKILDIQNTIYNSKNPTRKRLHQDRFLWVKNSLIYVKENKKISVLLKITLKRLNFQKIVMI